MAIGFTLSPQTDISVDTTSLLNGKSASTLGAWVNRTSGGINVIGLDNVLNNAFCMIWFSDNIMYSNVGTGSARPTGNLASADTATGWQPMMLVFDGSQSTNATRLRYWRGGAERTLTYAGSIPATLPTLTAPFRVGRSIASSTYSSNPMAEIAVWDAALTAGEIAAFAAGVKPSLIRPQRLMSYLPLVRDIQDVKSGLAITSANTSVVAHPRRYG